MIGAFSSGLDFLESWYREPDRRAQDYRFGSGNHRLTGLSHKLRHRDGGASIQGSVTWTGLLFGWILIPKYLILLDGTGWVVHASIQ